MYLSDSFGFIPLPLPPFLFEHKMICNVKTDSVFYLWFDDFRVALVRPSLLPSEACRQYECHTIFCVLKIPILSHESLRVGVQPKHKHFNKTLLFCVFKSNSRFEDKDYMKGVTFSWSMPVLHAKNSVATLFLSGCLYPQKVIRHMASDFDVCEINLDMQMSFLNAAPLVLKIEN